MSTKTKKRGNSFLEILEETMDSMDGKSAPYSNSGNLVIIRHSFVFQKWKKKFTNSLR